VSLRDGLPDARVIAIDIPIGLAECGPRSCDVAARRILGKPRSCSVFPAPVRPALGAECHSEASKLSYSACGKRLSIQSFSILPKIREVEKVMTRELQKRVFEVHPEVSLWALNKKSALKHRKRSRQGREERINLLAPEYRDLNSLLKEFGRRDANVDDLLDAAVAAWTARRIANGEHGRTSSVEFHGRGLRMEIAY